MPKRIERVALDINPEPQPMVPKPLEFDYTIGGKRVSFRRRVPQREGQEFWKRAMAVKQDDMDTHIPLLTMLVETWEFDGDPKDPEAYAEMDMFSEYMPLAKAAQEHIIARLDGLADVKNLAGAPSSR